MHLVSPAMGTTCYDLGTIPSFALAIKILVHELHGSTSSRNKIVRTAVHVAISTPYSESRAEEYNRVRKFIKEKYRVKLRDISRNQEKGICHGIS